MANLNQPITCFRNSLAEPAAEEPMPDALTPEYLRARERAERAAAKKATSVTVRRIHQQLAEAYATSRLGKAR